jgi:hypothetical protein
MTAPSGAILARLVVGLAARGGNGWTTITTPAKLLPAATASTSDTKMDGSGDTQVRRAQVTVAQAGHGWTTTQIQNTSRQRTRANKAFAESEHIHANQRVRLLNVVFFARSQWPRPVAHLTQGVILTLMCLLVISGPYGYGLRAPIRPRTASHPLVSSRSRNSHRILRKSPWLVSCHGAQELAHFLTHAPNEQALWRKAGARCSQRTRRTSKPLSSTGLSVLLL